MNGKGSHVQQIESAIDLYSRYTIKKIDSDDIYRQILHIEEKLRELTAQIGVELKVVTFISPQYDTVAAETYIGKLYRHDHFFNGTEMLRGGRTIHNIPDGISFCNVPHEKRYITGMKGPDEA